MRSEVIDAVRAAQFSHEPVWIGVQWWWLMRVEWRWEPDQPSGTLTGEFLSERHDRERRILNGIVDVERFTTEGRTGWRFITERERRQTMERTIEWTKPVYAIIRAPIGSMQVHHMTVVDIAGDPVSLTTEAERLARSETAFRFFVAHMLTWSASLSVVTTKLP